MTVGINLVVAVTDGGWFDFLRQRSDLNEVNFWAPSAVNFRALKPGELFLFKLKSPRNMIVGGGIFAYANTLPCSFAWEAFQEATVPDQPRNCGQLSLEIARFIRVTEAILRSVAVS